MIRSRQPFKRADRVADQVRQVVGDILLRRVPHHGVEGVTVTAVQLTDDLQHARVFYRVLDPNRRVEAAKAIASVARSVRRELGQELRLRYTPHLQFEYDESLDYGNRIDDLLRKAQRNEEE